MQVSDAVTQNNINLISTLRHVWTQLAQVRDRELGEG